MAVGPNNLRLDQDQTIQRVKDVRNSAEYKKFISDAIQKGASSGVSFREISEKILELLKDQEKIDKVGLTKALDTDQVQKQVNEIISVEVDRVAREMLHAGGVQKDVVEKLEKAKKDRAEAVNMAYEILDPVRAGNTNKSPYEIQYENSVKAKPLAYWIGALEKNLAQDEEQRVKIAQLMRENHDKHDHFDEYVTAKKTAGEIFSELDKGAYRFQSSVDQQAKIQDLTEDFEDSKVRYDQLENVNDFERLISQETLIDLNDVQTAVAEKAQIESEMDDLDENDPEYKKKQQVLKNRLRDKGKVLHQVDALFVYFQGRFKEEAKLFAAKLPDEERGKILKLVESIARLRVDYGNYGQLSRNISDLKIKVEGLQTKYQTTDLGGNTQNEFEQAKKALALAQNEANDNYRKINKAKRQLPQLVVGKLKDFSPDKKAEIEGFMRKLGSIPEKNESDAAEMIDEIREWFHSFSEQTAANPSKTQEEIQNEITKNETQLEELERTMQKKKELISNFRGLVTAEEDIKKWQSEIEKNAEGILYLKVAKEIEQVQAQASLNLKEEDRYGQVIKGINGYYWPDSTRGGKLVKPLVLLNFDPNLPEDNFESLKLRDDYAYGKDIENEIGKMERINQVKQCRDAFLVYLSRNRADQFQQNPKITAQELADMVVHNYPPESSYGDIQLHELLQTSPENVKNILTNFYSSSNVAENTLSYQLSQRGAVKYSEFERQYGYENIEHAEMLFQMLFQDFHDPKKSDFDPDLLKFFSTKNSFRVLLMETMQCFGMMNDTTIEKLVPKSPSNKPDDQKTEVEKMEELKKIQEINKEMKRGVKFIFERLKYYQIIHFPQADTSKLLAIYDYDKTMSELLASDPRTSGQLKNEFENDKAYYDEAMPVMRKKFPQLHPREIDGYMQFLCENFEAVEHGQPVEPLLQGKYSGLKANIARDMYALFLSSGSVEQFKYIEKYLSVKTSFDNIPVKGVIFIEGERLPDAGISLKALEAAREDYAQKRRTLNRFFVMKDKKPFGRATDEEIRISRQKYTDASKKYISDVLQTWFAGEKTNSTEAKLKIAERLTGLLAEERRKLLQMEMELQGPPEKWEQMKTWWRRQNKLRTIAGFALLGGAVGASAMGATTLGGAFLLGGAVMTGLGTNFLIENSWETLRKWRPDWLKGDLHILNEAQIASVTADPVTRADVEERTIHDSDAGLGEQKIIQKLAAHSTYITSHQGRAQAPAAQLMSQKELFDFKGNKPERQASGIHLLNCYNRMMEKAVFERIDGLKGGPHSTDQIIAAALSEAYVTDADGGGARENVLLVATENREKSIRWSNIAKRVFGIIGGTAAAIPGFTHAWDAIQTTIGPDLNVVKVPPAPGVAAGQVGEAPGQAGAGVVPAHVGVGKRALGRADVWNASSVFTNENSPALHNVVDGHAPISSGHHVSNTAGSMEHHATPAGNDWVGALPDAGKAELIRQDYYYSMVVDVDGDPNPGIMQSLAKRLGVSIEKIWGIPQIAQELQVARVDGAGASFVDSEGNLVEGIDAVKAGDRFVLTPSLIQKLSAASGKSGFEVAELLRKHWNRN